MNPTFVVVAHIHLDDDLLQREEKRVIVLLWTNMYFCNRIATLTRRRKNFVRDSAAAADWAVMFAVDFVNNYYSLNYSSIDVKKIDWRCYYNRVNNVHRSLQQHCLQIDEDCCSCSNIVRRNDCCNAIGTNNSFDNACCNIVAFHRSDFDDCSSLNERKTRQTCR